MTKPNRVRAIIHLRSGKALNVWVPADETVLIKNLTSDTKWMFSPRRMFASDTAKYILLGSQIECFEVL